MKCLSAVTIETASKCEVTVEVNTQHKLAMLTIAHGRQELSAYLTATEVKTLGVALQRAALDIPA